MKLVSILCKITLYASAFFLVAMMVITCADVGGNIFLSPILGAEEIVGLLAAIVLALSLPTAEQENKQVGVDLLFRKLPPSVQKIIDIITHIIGCLLFVLIAWQCFIYALTLQASGEVSTTIKFPYYILVFIISGAFLVLSIVIGVKPIKKYRR